MIRDVATDGRQEVEGAAVAGENGSFEVRPVEVALDERSEKADKRTHIQTQMNALEAGDKLVNDRRTALNRPAAKANIPKNHKLPSSRDSLSLMKN